MRGDFNIAGQNFQWGEEGIFGLALSPIRSDGFRTLYFSPLASHREFSVSTRVLRDESRAEDSYHDFFYFPTERAANSHTTSRVCSDDGIMLFNLIDQNAVGCWHTSMPYEPQYHGVVDRDDVGLVFPADVKVDENRNVWVISDRMSVFLNTNLDYNDVNFRIFSTSLQSLIGGTVCDISNRISSRFGLNSVLSTRPTKPNLFSTNSVTRIPNGFGNIGLGNVGSGNVGLGAFKTLNSNSPNSLQSLQPLQGSLGNIQPIQSVQPIQIQPLVSYDVREPLQQSFTSKPVVTKAPGTGSYSYKANSFGATMSQSTADFTSAIQNLPKSSSWWTTQLW